MRLYSLSVVLSHSQNKIKLIFAQLTEGNFVFFPLSTVHLFLLLFSQKRNFLQQQQKNTQDSCWDIHSPPISMIKKNEREKEKKNHVSCQLGVEIERKKEEFMVVALWMFWKVIRMKKRKKEKSKKRSPFCVVCVSLETEKNWKENKFNGNFLLILKINYLSLRWKMLIHH